MTMSVKQSLSRRNRASVIPLCSNEETLTSVLKLLAYFQPVSLRTGFVL